jgi:hypothetical protein|tara:strand:+ start:12374 stop:13291 length:918 start_codon:yes stop_codon:yes gene_type:complete
MIDISFEKNRELYEDYEECIKFLKTIKESDYEYPKEKIKFHIYTEVKTEKELMSIKSYLATQNLDKTELMIWSDYDITDNPLIQPYKHLVTFKIYDPEEEAIGTPLEGNPKLKMKDPKYYLQSDLARILLLYKYGGVWYDMDVILLRDFKPLLDQEYMYMWGSETNFSVDGACATVLAGLPRSEFMSKLLLQLINTPAIPGTTCWGKRMFATLYKSYKFDIMPAAFFNIEWYINRKTPGLGCEIESQWFLKPLEDHRHMFLDSFGWHWHNSSKKEYETVEGSKFNLLEKLINKKLKEKNINETTQ